MKHDVRRCTTCRDYARHEKATRGPGNWPAKLGTIHLADRVGPKRFVCGLRRRSGSKTLWALSIRGLVTCRTCRRVARCRARR